jgi:hypothetical protein
MTYRAAAKIPSRHQHELMVAARRRTAFVRALLRFHRKPHDATAAKSASGSYAGSASRWLFGLRSSLLGQTHLGDSLLACARAEESAMRGYAHALDASRWNEAISDVLEDQMSEIGEAAERARALRGQL